MKKVDSILIRLSSAALCLCLISSASAVGVSYDPWNWVENSGTDVGTLKNYYENLAQVRNQVQQIRNEETQLKNTDFHHMSDITQAASDIGDEASAGQALTYSSSDINQRFDKDFGSSNPKSKNWADKESQRLNTILDTSKGSLNAASKQMQYTKGQSSGLDQIVNSSNTAGGTKAVLQGTNMLLDATAAQMQSVQQTMSQTQSQQATVAAANAAKEKSANSADDQFLNYQAEYTGYKVSNNLKSVPDFSS
jgi:type IV secretion system protein TrbJ